MSLLLVGLFFIDLHLVEYLWQLYFILNFIGLA